MKYPIKFGKYLLLDRINVGGMAEVFKAKAFGIKGFERILAIKRILPTMAEDDEFINMFVDEARIAVQLSHANIVQVYELANHQSQYYIAMEYVSGRDLRQVLDDVHRDGQTLPLPLAAFICSRICEGLDYAHGKTDPTGKALNVIHRDVSPQNILLGYDGAVKITDFGIAKAEDRASRTQAGVLKGKFGYMSPEQVRGLTIDHRSDVFAVGILFYEMVTGHRLFIGENDFSTLESVRNADVPPPTEYKPDLDPELEAVMLRALAAERDERFESAGALQEALRPFLVHDAAPCTGKKLSEYLVDRYDEAIETEKRKMEEFANVAPPRATTANESVTEAAQSIVGPAVAGGDWGDDAWDSDDDRTMIFESGFDFGDDHTRATFVPDELTRDKPESKKKAQPVSGAKEEPGKPLASGQPARPKPVASKSWMGSPIVWAAGVACALIVGAWWVSGRSNTSDSGTIMVNSEPVQDVRVWLDGTLIGDGTPFRYTPVKPGSHIIEAKAVGYMDKRFSFEVRAGQQVRLEIPMERVSRERLALTDGVLQVVTDPPGATVLLDGIEKGKSPITIEGVARSRPVALTVRRADYLAESRTVTFKDGESTQQVDVRLRSMEPGPAPAEATDKGPQVTHAIVSSPSGAKIWIDGQLFGTTPASIKNLEAGQSYRIKIGLAGYRVFDRAMTADEIGDQFTIALKPLADLDTKEKPKARTASRTRQGKASARARQTEQRSDDVGAGSRCQGSGAELSVMPVGVGDCRVQVGSRQLGVAPFFRKVAPVGDCVVSVRCPQGRGYKTVKRLVGNRHTKVIIRESDWSQGSAG